MSAEMYFDDEVIPEYCEKCGAKMEYKGVGEYQCSECKNIVYDDYGKVRNFIEMYPGANAVQISEATGVSVNKITYLLKEERLQISANSKSFLRCIACGKEIKSGRYCSDCTKIAEAAAKRKKEKLEKSKHNFVGYSTDLHKGENGARRFRRDEE